MIRIGHSRWLPAASSARIDGKLELRLSLSPQARRIKIFAMTWNGRLAMADVTVEPRPVSKSSRIDPWDARGKGLLVEAGRLAREVAADAVSDCLAAGIVSHEGYDKAAGIHFVETALKRVIQRGEDDDPPQTIDEVDLSGDMRVAHEERQRQVAEARRRRQVQPLKITPGAAARSMDLLYEYLTEEERATAMSSGHVTVRRPEGDFVVPIIGHGLIRHYSGGKYVKSYCVVFRDYSIPLGDEAIMKIALLKTDPQRLFRIANAFVERSAQPAKR